MNIQYHFADVKRVVSANALERGLEYANNARVVRFDVSGDGATISSLVQGNGSTPYKQSIQCKPFPGGVGLQGFCSCPMQFNCKHVAAALLHGLFETGSLELEETPRSPFHPEPRLPEREMDYALRAWLDTLSAPATASAAASANPMVLAYAITREAPRAARLTLYTARPKKDGSLGGAQPLNRQISDILRERPAYMAPGDVPLLEQLLVLSLGSGWQGVNFDGERALGMIAPLLETGRLFWRKPSNSTPLRLGPTRKAQISWRTADDGSQSVLIEMRPGAEVLPFAPPWYVDPVSAETGPIECGLPQQLALQFALAPRVQPLDVAAVRAALQQTDAAAPLPRALQTRVVTDAPAECWLRLASVETEVFHRRQHTLTLDIAELRFAYEGQFTTDAVELRRLDGDTLRILRRNPKSEKNALRQLKQLGLSELYLSHPNHVADDDIGKGVSFAPSPSSDISTEEFWVDFVTQQVPALQARGWHVEIDASFRFNIASGAQWYATTEEQGHDWFEFELGVEIDGQRVSLLPALARLFASLSPQQLKSIDDMRDEQFTMLRLPDGRLLPVGAARLRPLAALLVELYDRGGAQTRLRLSRFDAARINELEAGLSARWITSERLHSLGARLREFTGISEVAPPAGLKAQLRPYQRAGLNWLQFLREYQLAGVLADDMGLGKTIQTLAHLLSEKESGRADLPSLVIAPTSLMYNWSAEAARFAASLRVLRLQGAERKRDFERLGEFDLVLSTYPLLARDKEVLLKQDFHFVILDEAQNIKNAKTQAAGIARELNARHRLCLTGTPLENHLGELWSLFHFLLPGFLGSEQQFRELYRTPIEKQGDLGRQSALAKRVAPFMLRRTKDQVAKELPAKTEILRTVELSGAQRDLYETLRVAMHERVQQEIASKGLARSHIVILDALLKLRQVCCDPRLVKLERAKVVKDSAKLELFTALLPQLIEEGRKVLVFSQFTSMLALIEIELKQAGVAYSLLTGETRDRAAQIEAFQHGPHKVFLLSLKAGGTGLNLTAADTVIHYDPWWNPQVERQATDRAHRIGQDKPVFVYKLIAAGSVEEKIVALQEKKAALVRGVLEQDAAAMTSLSGADLQALFEPMQ